MGTQSVKLFIFARDHGQWVTRGYVRHLWVMIHNAVGEVILEKGGAVGGVGREKKEAKVIGYNKSQQSTRGFKQEKKATETNPT
jgi:hypothetical protein